MAGLLDPTPDQAMFLTLLGAGGMRGDWAGGGLLAMQHMAGAKEREMRGLLAQAQLDEARAQGDERKAKAASLQAEMQRQQGIQRGLPGVMGGGYTGGEPVPQTMGGMPMFSQPMGVTPVQPRPQGFDVGRAITELRMKPDEATAYFNAMQLGRPEVARVEEVDDGRGGKVKRQLDKYGNPVGSDMAGYIAPVQVNRGGQIDMVRPTAGQTFGVTMSPSERDASARGWASNRLASDRFNFDKEQAGNAKAPSGYRPTANGGLEYIPGGPADPNAAKKAAPTEFQGKAAMFGDRAQEADRIITGLDGKYSPAAVNTKLAADNAPWYLGGGVTGAIGNAITSKEAQQAEQAQRDFINAILRLESGAAIGKDEFTNARKQYFPQPGDSRDVVEQKAANRKRAISGLMNNARTSAEPTRPQSGGATGSWDANNDPLGLRK